MFVLHGPETSVCVSECAQVRRVCSFIAVVSPTRTFGQMCLLPQALFIILMPLILSILLTPTINHVCVCACVTILTRLFWFYSDTGYFRKFHFFFISKGRTRNTLAIRSRIKHTQFFVLQKYVTGIYLSVKEDSYIYFCFKYKVFLLKSVHTIYYLLECE